jgi:quercetin dioxygenase-like cupin family protein
MACAEIESVPPGTPSLGSVPMAQPVRSSGAEEHAIYVVAGGNHVTIELDRTETGGVLDAIEVFARPGGGPPPHRHEFAEWFLVREGTLTICEERDGTVVPTREVAAGGSFWVPPWVVHGTLNLTEDDVRFQTVGQPGLMSGYFAEAGVKVADPGEAPEVTPSGPAEVGEIATRWGIEFWTGPVERPDA